MIDWVPNHTQRPASVVRRVAVVARQPEARLVRTGATAIRKRPPNNWIANFTGESAWTWDETTGQWYLHLFLPEQPDLNWNNPDVVAAMHDTLRFWLDRGVDGFRIDVVHAIGKGPDLPDMPAERQPLEATLFHDYPRTHDLLRDIRTLLDSYPGDRTMVGEVYILSTAKVAEYYGDDDELHLAFNFPPLYAPWDADRVAHAASSASSRSSSPRDAWPTWVLSNHDNPRHRTRYGGSEARARAAAVLLLTLRGTPFLYAGEELGPRGRRRARRARRRSRRSRRVPGADPVGRHRRLTAGRPRTRGCRGRPTPTRAMPTPWSPTTDSIAHLYRRLLTARRNSPALSAGDMTLHRPSPAVWCRSSAGRATTLASFSSTSPMTPSRSRWTAVSSSKSPATAPAKVPRTGAWSPHPVR